jgi:hypothetical protein
MAARLFRKNVHEQLPGIVKKTTLPSTSPMRGTYVKSLDEKKKDWAIIKKIVIALDSP